MYCVGYLCQLRQACKRRVFVQLYAELKTFEHFTTPTLFLETEFVSVRSRNPAVVTFKLAIRRPSCTDYKVFGTSLKSSSFGFEIQQFSFGTS